MLRRVFISLLLFSLTLSACSKDKAVEAGKGRAEITCLLFDSSLSLEELEQKTEAISQDYGFETSDELYEYIDTIRGTEEFNRTVEAVRTQLEKSCGDALREAGVDPIELTESLTNE